MINFQDPVRANCAVEVGPYTFKNRRTKSVINLSTDFSTSSVVCQVKQEGLAWTTLAGAVVLSAAAGTVHVPSATFAPGVWQYQFFCVDGSGNRLAGEPVQFTAFKNEEDTAASEMLKV